MDRNKLMAALRQDEGVRNRMYEDSQGYRTIGVGHNLDAKPISDAAVNQILSDDIDDVVSEIKAHIPFFSTLNDKRQNVLLNMAFNLGIAGLLKFKNMLSAVQAGNFDEVAKQMLNSTWAKQVGKRAIRLAEEMK